ncbi:hypothetical protein EU245_14320 [Lentibacillus lipolyticus]|nr:hypothetical protein EU245_14320 [Lentibacillus lipolyticus]
MGVLLFSGYRTETYINGTDKDYKVEVTHENGSYTTYTEMSSKMNKFFTDHKSLLEDNAEVSVTVDKDDRITGIEAIKLLGNETDETDGDLTIPAGAAFDGLTIDGNEKSIDDLTVNADNVTVRDLTVDVLSGNGESFESIHNTFEEDSSFSGNDASFNTTFEGDVTLKGENAHLSNVKIENGKLAVSAGASVTVDGETTIQDVVAEGEASLEDVEVTGNVTANGEGSVKLSGKTTVDGDLTGNIDASQVEDEELKGEAEKVANRADVDAAVTALTDGPIEVVAGQNFEDIVAAKIDDSSVEFSADSTEFEGNDVFDKNEVVKDVTADNSAEVDIDLTKGEVSDPDVAVSFKVVTASSVDAVVSALNDNSQSELEEALSNDAFTGFNSELIGQYHTELDAAGSLDVHGNLKLDHDSH